MIYFVRSGLLRNLGGCTDPRLFAHSYLGTKQLIDDYHIEVDKQLEEISHSHSLSLQQKAELFSNTRQGFGSTALLLQGGATFGLYHLGVVKALNERGLLPRIISGSAVGALIAALVCVHTDEELPAIFIQGGIDLKAFAKKGTEGSMRRKFDRLRQHGHLLDVKVLEDCVRSNVGDITFEEAYGRTRKILNITVSSARKNEVPRLLNYLTAPNVLIWSAACASAGGIGLYESVDLLAKDLAGNIVQWSPSAIKWGDATLESESPEMRLGELFNVNHFILSQAFPSVALFLNKGQSGGITSKILSLITSEMGYRLNQV
ncbi:acyl transferase/acyl hydrolase/lysophospholipase, partial [Blyttiomyces helicus]